MLELVKLSLSRRFFNRMTLNLFLVLVLLLSFLFFSDQILPNFLPDLFSKVKVKTDKIDSKLFFEIGKDYFVEDQEANILLSFEEGNYFIESEEEISFENQEALSLVVAQYHSFLYGEDYELFFPKTEQVSKLPYLFITAIYFMILSFSTLIVNEIVLEKSNNIIELIGSMIPLKKHYQAKIILGYLSLLFQMMVFVGIFSCVFFIRNQWDQGKNLLNFFYKLGFLDKDYSSFSSFYKSLDLNKDSWKLFLISFLSLSLGMLMIQIFMVLISSKISNIEEAGMIQTPFYLVLLFIYYLSVFLHQNEMLEGSVFYYLQYFPIFSMLLFPLEMASRVVVFEEYVFYFSSLLLSLTLFYRLGYYYYSKNIFYRKGNKKKS